MAKLRREIDRLTMDEGEKLRRMETLKYQIAEIEKAELEPGEDERLEDRRKILQNAEKLSNGMETAVECLYGGDDTDGAAGCSHRRSTPLRGCPGSATASTLCMNG